MRDAKSRDDYRRRMADPRTARAQRLRNTARWQTFRSLWLDEHPFCVLCEAEGRVASATQVDHVVALRRFDVDAMYDACFDPANVQGLCIKCHAAKSARENAQDRGGFNAR